MASNAELTLKTLQEIQRKAASGVQLSSPTAEKNALYDYYKSNPTASVTGGISAGTLSQIQSKAASGTSLSSPTGEKNALYNALKPIGNPISKPINQMPITALGSGAQPTGTTVQQQQPFSPSPTAGPTQQPIANWNSNQSIPDFLGMSPDMIQKAFDQASSGSNYYDPSKDPVYQSMLELSGKQADKAGLATMEHMNERGILNSTVTADRVGQIKQGASDAVLAAIPGLAGNYDNKQMANAQSMQGLINSVLGAGQFQQGFAEDNRRFDKNFSLDEAKVTGRYMAPEAQQALQSLFEAKAVAEDKSLTPQQRQAMSADNAKKAADARAILSGLGVDITAFGSNVTLDQAMKNAYYSGRDSLPQQQMDLEKSTVTGKVESTRAQGLIQQVLAAKERNEKGIGNRQHNAKEADEARRQLEALGFDTRGIAGNVKYATALNNASNMGAPTLAAINASADRQLQRDRMDNEMDMFGQELGFKQDSFGREMDFKEDSFGREMQYKEQLALIDADLQSRGLDLEELKIGISRFTAESDAEYRQFQQDSGVSEVNATKNTNKAIGEAIKAKSAADALEFISDSASSWAAQGVDVRAVLDAIYKRFPETRDAMDGGGGIFGSNP